MKKLHKSASITFRSFTGMLLIFNSLILPQLNAMTIQSADVAGPLQTELHAQTPVPATKLVVATKPATTGRVIYVTVTAYSSTPDQTDSTPFITANGTHVRDGIIAANFLKFGTKVKFPDYSGNKIYEVTDRMNARYTNRADIWMETREEAIQFGLRTLKMEILPAPQSLGDVGPAVPVVLAEK